MRMMLGGWTAPEAAQIKQRMTRLVSQRFNSSRFLFRDAQLLELRRDVRAMVGGLDLVVDVQNLAVLANVKGHAGSVFLFRRHDAKGLGRRASRVSQDGIIGVQRV